MTSTRFRILTVAAVLTTAVTLLPDPVDAQGRRGRPVVRRGGAVVAAYYRPLYYRSPFFYDAWYPYYNGWYPPYAYGQYYDTSSSLRVQVTPRDTEVFVDGYYAGTVDDFDGVFQRLRLEPGDHDVTLYLAGHRTVTQKIFLQPNGTFRIRHEMEALPAGAPPEPRPVANAAPRPAPRMAGSGVRQREQVQGEPAAVSNAEFGTIVIRVQPGDAEVLIDGERWQGPAGDEALVVQVAPGAHRVEVRKSGYRSYSAQLDVRAGHTAPINVSLPRQ